MLTMLQPFVSHEIFTEPESKRALPAEKLLKIAGDNNAKIIYKYGEALNYAKKLRKTVLITGSLYLSGAMRNIIMGGNHGHKQV
jgi:folylpolyglutamate synthase/dihydropteroate synthase